MTATTIISIPTAAAGVEVDVTIPMTVPAEEGVHVGEWRLRNAAGQDFGPILNLTVYTRPGCSTPPVLSFFKAEPAAIGEGALSLLSWGQVRNADQVEIVDLGSVDPNGNRLLVQPDKTTTYTLQATCGSQTVMSQATVTVDTSLPAFVITGVTTTADPAQFNGSCADGETIQFSGEFTSNGPGVVLYHWDRSDSSTSSPRLFMFDQAGMQTLKEEWTFWGSMQGWMEMQILAPVQSDPARADFSLSCSP